ncbi:MAG: hypothetical protein MK165_01310 [Pirellulaceae bacterium]|nr:hypothetical protein [Pirellulaceae bacterium]
MRQLIAVEWDAFEGRVVLASTSGRGLVVEDAFAVELTGESNKASSTLRKALAAKNIGRRDALVAVGRASAELRMLTLPHAPMEELPEMVRFQAVRQFTSLGENWPLDFVHVDTGNQESLTVLAATIAQDLVKEARSLCEEVQLVPQRMVLRPFAAASLLQRRIADGPEDCRLMVDLLADEADLTVMVGGQVVMMRTFRPPTEGGDEALHLAVIGEMRRTIGSAQGQLSGRRITKATILGDSKLHRGMRDAIAERLSTLEVDVIDPFAGIDVASDNFSKSLGHAGRFASLLGLLLDEAEEQSHAIDFLHPRKKPEPKSRSRLLVSLGIAVATMLVFSMGIIWFLLRSLDNHNAELAEEITGQKIMVERSQERLDDTQLVDEFVDAGVVWLDEVAWLSRNLLGPDEAILRRISFRTNRRTGSKMILDGAVQDAELIDDLESGLRDPRHVVDGDDGAANATDSRYPATFRAQILLQRAVEAESTSTDAGGEEIPTKETGTTSPNDDAELKSPSLKSPPSEDDPDERDAEEENGTQGSVVQNDREEAQ